MWQLKPVTILCPLIALAVFPQAAVSILHPSNLYCSSDVDEGAINYCRFPDACKRNFNTFDEVTEMDIFTCRTSYYTQTCPEVGGLDFQKFQPKCLPPQVSSCAEDSKCSAETTMLWWYGAACGLDSLKLKYGPDRQLVSRRELIALLCGIIFENLFAFLVPFIIAVAACIIFFPRRKPKDESGADEPGKTWKVSCPDAVKPFQKQAMGIVMPLMSMVALVMAASMAVSTLYRFWKEIDSYYETLHFNTHCNFVLVMDFVSNSKSLDVFALASFTVFDFVLTLSIVFWCLMLSVSGCIAVCCCQLRQLCCCVMCKYFTCPCCCSYLASTICASCAAVVFLVCLVPLLLYYLIVGVAVLITYGLVLLILIATILLAVYLSRLLLAASCCGKVVEFATPTQFAEELGMIAERELRNAMMEKVSPIPQLNDNETTPMKVSKVLQQVSTFALLTLLVPLVFMLIVMLLPGIADSAMQNYAFNHVDLTAFFNDFQTPLSIWERLFKDEWVAFAEGITDFAKTAFTVWPVTIWDDVKASLTSTGEGYSSGIEENVEPTKVWLQGDWKDYKQAILLGRSWLSALDGVIVFATAVHYALTQELEEDKPPVGQPTRVNE